MSCRVVCWHFAPRELERYGVRCFELYDKLTVPLTQSGESHIMYFYKRKTPLFSKPLTSLQQGSPVELAKIIEEITQQIKGLEGQVKEAYDKMQLINPCLADVLLLRTSDNRQPDVDELLDEINGMSVEGRIQKENLALVERQSLQRKFRDLKELEYTL